jgi:capsular polysaccharide biosynthesis protein
MKYIESRAVTASWKLYGRLLAVYPRKHRREFGPAMAQLFRDQCRDAWSASRVWGLAKLWFRVLLDLIKTSVLEHFTNLKGEQTMLQTIIGLTRFRYAPLTTFIVGFLVLFGTTLMVTLLMQKSYVGIARVKVERETHQYDPYLMQTEFEVMQSETILNKVIEDLHLQAKWGDKYAGGKPLTLVETRSLLRGRLELRLIRNRLIRNAPLLDVQVYDHDNNEAAVIANKIVETYRAYRVARLNGLHVSIIESAQPATEAMHPNVPLNLFLGAAVSCLLGGALAGVIYLIGRSQRGASSKPTSATVVTSSERIVGVLWAFCGAALVGGFVLVPITYWVAGETIRLTDVTIIILVGTFFGCTSIGGFLLYRGKAWVKIPLGVVAAILALIEIVELCRVGLYMMVIPTYFTLIMDALLLLSLVSPVILFWPRRAKVDAEAVPSP